MFLCSCYITIKCIGIFLFFHVWNVSMQLLCYYKLYSIFLFFCVWDIFNNTAKNVVAKFFHLVTRRGRAKKKLFFDISCNGEVNWNIKEFASLATMYISHYGKIYALIRVKPSASEEFGNLICITSHHYRIIILVTIFWAIRDTIYIVQNDIFIDTKPCCIDFGLEIMEKKFLNKIDLCFFH